MLPVTFRSYGANAGGGNLQPINILPLRDWVDSTYLREPQQFKPSDHRSHNLANAALQLAVVGDGRAHCYFSSGNRRDTERNELCGVNQ
jgi:hypothetical protein